jgi:streptomycin 6-kinase
LEFVIRGHKVSDFAIPDHLQWLQREPGGRQWLESLPLRVAEALQSWSLTLDHIYQTGCESYVAKVVRANGSAAVLKVHFPGRENAREAAALAVWRGDGAVTLLEQMADSHTLLIEYCSPGSHLRDLACDAALDVYRDLLPRLWKSTDDNFSTLRDEASRWARGMRREWERTGCAVPKRWIDSAVSMLGNLAPSQGGCVLLHQDLHADNILRAERLPWLAIDPKPLLGEREFAVAPIVRSNELGHSKKLVLRRLDRLTAELSLDRERARAWTIAQTVAWSMGAEHTEHHDTIRWLLEES